METKKNKNASIERMRAPIALTGLLFTGSIVLASFTYTSGTARDEANNYSASESHIILDPQMVTNTPPPPAPQTVDAMLPPDENILIDSNNNEEIVHVIAVLPPPDINLVVGDPPVDDEIIEFPDVEASFLGGAAAMQKWISENVQYPQTSIELNEQGKVYMSFVVEPDGSISNISVERGVSADLDREAKRLMRNMPDWKPGEAKGKKARTRCRLPINFTLN